MTAPMNSYPSYNVKLEYRDGNNVYRSFPGILMLDLEYLAIVDPNLRTRSFKRTDHVVLFNDTVYTVFKEDDECEEEYL